ncbi:hypothetical protein I550_3969 [Mycobacterium intracellulare 1956]|uniref:Uncharacterized protein n=1 Tax=Mycobacterium intracellulare 1956 TaxID=1299331 RepID=X8CHI4_MYCIT|nr:hypothetical protein I550_3969 [Mycobacterium intracellulare 1956]
MNEAAGVIEDLLAAPSPAARPAFSIDVSPGSSPTSGWRI